ncbi:J domain-containing protein [Hymenobacter sp. GOD-10R]|uniref:J domain-containing protein n=1 Tax=Hymenobacter sp. GOD-10R TaxID=3093922 RepID=UPI002D795821|nr:J domain-containing protein [Hymenobacter sp. GOD-10R]WRQ30392.1 J domain-containing protein [Hymenobacter sp. GOD-10R]
MNLHNPAIDLPAAQHVPVKQPAEAPSSPAQQAFRQAVQDVESLRQRLRDLKAEQADARRRYWQQVGPLAQTVVAARRALYQPLEEALLLGYFNRGEERQIVEVIVGNARSLQDRFGEDEAEILQKYDPATKPPRPTQPEPATEPSSHEEAARQAKATRKTKAERAAEAAAQQAREEQQRLLSNTKTVYRQLARVNHPDLERDPERAAAKTTRMQRITEAYEANDLYTLLQLLAEDSAEAPDDNLLARYTQALQQQQTELKQQLNELKYGANGFSGSTGKKQEAELRQLKRHLRAEAEYLAHVAGIIAEPAGLRDALKDLASAEHDTF